MESQQHIVKAFDEELDQMMSLIVEMGGLVETQIIDAAAALVRRDSDLAARVIAGDKIIDALEIELDNLTVKVLALRQPKANDLRTVVAALKISSNLERIGDYAKNIAKRTNVLSMVPVVGSSATTINRMSTMVQTMVSDVLNAFVHRDLNSAIDVRQRDEEVDQMHNTLFRELLTYMMEDPRNITPCMHLLFIAKNVERMGDHATGIAEQVHYMVCGEMPDDERPKGDKTSYVFVEPNEVDD